MAKSKFDYSAASIELDDILAKLQQPGIQVDDAIQMYKQGLMLIDQLEAHLKQAENTIETLKLATDKADK